MERGCLKVALKARRRGEDGVAAGKDVCKVVPGEGIGSDVMWRGSGECVKVDVGDGCKHQGSL